MTGCDWFFGLRWITQIAVSLTRFYELCMRCIFDFITMTEGDSNSIITIVTDDGSRFGDESHVVWMKEFNIPKVEEPLATQSSMAWDTIIASFQLVAGLPERGLFSTAVRPSFKRLCHFLLMSDSRYFRQKSDESFEWFRSENCQASDKTWHNIIIYFYLLLCQIENVSDWQQIVYCV